MAVVELIAHPATVGNVPERVIVTTEWVEPGRLRLGYRLQGDIGQLRVPPPAPSARADDLWRHTCCEAFLRPREAEAYCEFNFSPSGEWAAYQFTGRRQGMRPVDGIDPPAIRVDRDPEALVLEVTFDPGSVAALPPEAGLELGLAVVAEDREGRHTFWAIRHLSVQPDFHDPSSFELSLLAASERSPEDSTA
jgi:hypothetical protein